MLYLEQTSNGIQIVGPQTPSILCEGSVHDEYGEPQSTLMQVVVGVEVVVGAPVGPFITIDYGTGGYRSRVAFIDPKNGISFPVAAETVRVTGNVLGAAGTSIALAASLSLNGTARKHPPVISGGVGGLIIGGVNIAAIPPYAQAVTFQTSDFLGQNVQCEFLNRAGVVWYEHWIQPGQIQPTIPLTGIVDNIQLTNAGAAIIDIRAFFDVEM